MHQASHVAGLVCFGGRRVGVEPLSLRAGNGSRTIPTLGRFAWIGFRLQCCVPVLVSLPHRSTVVLLSEIHRFAQRFCMYFRMSRDEGKPRTKHCKLCNKMQSIFTAFASSRKGEYFSTTVREFGPVVSIYSPQIVAGCHLF